MIVLPAQGYAQTVISAGKSRIQARRTVELRGRLREIAELAFGQSQLEMQVRRRF